MVIKIENGGLIMKLGVAQLQPSGDKIENLKKAEKYIKRAKEQGVDMIVFPEAYMSQIFPDSTITRADVAESIDDGDGPFLNGLAQAAKSSEIYVVCGVFESKPNETKRAYNTAVIFDRSGKLIYRYRKTHLYDSFSVKESNVVVPGEEPQKIIETEFGKIGLMICYELRFPEIARELTLQGADMIIIPTAWVDGIMKEHHWKTLLQARAIENTIYVIGADKVGGVTVGNSIIVDPMGVVVAGSG
jgi:predicted amidohydrolase